MRYEGTVYRPPGEWKSYLLQVTVGCSHNACTFCGMYKDKRYRVRPLEEIFEDIALARAAYGDVKRVFLCDGDAVAMDTEELLAVLDPAVRDLPLPRAGQRLCRPGQHPAQDGGRAGGPPPGGAGAPLPRGGERKRRGAAGGAQGGGRRGYAGGRTAHNGGRL